VCERTDGYQLGLHLRSIEPNGYTLALIDGRGDRLEVDGELRGKSSGSSLTFFGISAVREDLSTHMGTREFAIRTRLSYSNGEVSFQLSAYPDQIPGNNRFPFSGRFVEVDSLSSPFFGLYYTSQGAEGLYDFRERHSTYDCESSSKVQFLAVAFTGSLPTLAPRETLPYTLVIQCEALNYRSGDYFILDTNAASFIRGQGAVQIDWSYDGGWLRIETLDGADRMEFHSISGHGVLNSEQKYSDCSFNDLALQREADGVLSDEASYDRVATSEKVPSQSLQEPTPSYLDIQCGSGEFFSLDTAANVFYPQGIVWDVGWSFDGDWLRIIVLSNNERIAFHAWNGNVLRNGQQIDADCAFLDPNRLSELPLSETATLRRAFVNLPEPRRMEVQGVLSSFGTYTSLIDGLWGPSTESALLAMIASEPNEVSIATEEEARAYLVSLWESTYEVGEECDGCEPVTNSEFGELSGASEIQAGFVESCIASVMLVSRQMQTLPFRQFLGDV